MELSRFTRGVGYQGKMRDDRNETQKDMKGGNDWERREMKVGHR